MEWDKYFHNICKEVSKNSKCFSRQIGSILVKDKSIISTGYNGPPRGIRKCDERWFYDENLRKKAGYNYNINDLEDKEFVDLYVNNFEGKCPRYIPEMGYKSGEGLEYCIAGHSERNTLINAARYGIATKGCKLYMDCGIPCTPCLVEIINSGIEEIIVTKIEYYDVSAEYLLNISSLRYRIFEHLKTRRI